MMNEKYPIGNYKKRYPKKTEQKAYKITSIGSQIALFVN